jgi:beta-lactamase regulating signal transducer with metallopeptidase domain
MIQFSYGFCMAMLHSFWQAALLLLLYNFIDAVLFRNNSPLAKRNFLFAMLASQVTLFLLTFYIYFSGATADNIIAALAQNLSALAGSGNIQLVTPWLFGCYLLVIAYKMSKAVYTWRSFKLQYKQGLQKPGADLKVFTQLKAHQFGIKRKVQLWLSNTVNTPVTFGFFKPIILLPVALVNNISARQAETLILHELTHIRANDYLLNWFLLFTDTIFFFNPFVSAICKKIRLEREKYCDISVIAFEYSPILYAETLLKAERIKKMVPSFQLAAVSRKKQLLHRIQFFTNDKNLKQHTRFNILAPVLALFLLLLFSSSLLFNSGSAVSSSHVTAAMPYLPINTLELREADYVNTTLPAQYELETKTKKAGKQSYAATIAAAPLPKTKEAVTDDQLDEELADLYSTQPDPVFAMPATTQQNEAGRQIIIKEESSGSKTSSVRVYNLRFENGQWILQPEWILTAKEVLLDSLSKKIDSLNTNLKRTLRQQ